MPAPHRRWFQFRLRTLLAAVVVLAIPCAWVAHSLKWIRDRHAVLVEHIQGFGVVAIHHDAPQPPRGLWLFGEAGVSSLVFSPGMSNSERVRLRALFPEAVVVDLGPEAVTSKLTQRPVLTPGKLGRSHLHEEIDVVGKTEASVLHDYGPPAVKSYGGAMRGWPHLSNKWPYEVQQGYGGVPAGTVTQWTYPHKTKLECVDIFFDVDGRALAAIRSMSDL